MEERYRIVFQNASCGMLVLELDGRVRDFNPAATRMMGSARGNIHRRLLSDFFVPRFAKAFPEKLRLLEQLGHIVLDGRLQGEDGIDVLLDLSLVPLEDESRGVLAILRELAPREKLERELELQRQIIQARWDRPSAGMPERLLLILSPDGAMELYPEPTDSEEGRRRLEAIRPLFDEPKVKAAAERAWAGEFVALSPGWFVQPGGGAEGTAAGVRFLRVELAPLRGHEEAVVKVMAVIEDGTGGRAEQEEERRGDHRAVLGLFAGALFHEFNNYLGVILAQASALRLATPPGKLVPPALGAILDASQKAAGLLRRTTEAAQDAQEGWGAVDLNRCASEAVRILQYLLAPHVTVGFEPGEGLPEIRGDARLLRSMVVALGRHAGAYMPAGGELTVRSFRIEGSAASPPGAGLAVRDSGVGMDALARAQVMDSLVPVAAAGPGDPLDLAIARAAILQHRGRFELESAPGQGTTVTISFSGLEARPKLTGHEPARKTLPDEAVMEEQLAQSASAVPAFTSYRLKSSFESGAHSVLTHRPRVLLADDEENFRDFCRACLQGIGCDVTSAADGLEAFEHFQEDPTAYSLAILDAYMPRLGGLEAYLRMQALRPDLPVIFVSGFVRGASREALIAACPGRAQVLLKPFSGEQLTGEVGRMMERSEK